jgi:hypothetical protein
MEFPPSGPAEGRPPAQLLFGPEPLRTPCPPSRTVVIPAWGAGSRIILQGLLEGDRTPLIASTLLTESRGLEADTWGEFLYLVRVGDTNWRAAARAPGTRLAPHVAWVSSALCHRWSRAHAFHDGAHESPRSGRAKGRLMALARARAS